MDIKKMLILLTGVIISPLLIGGKTTLAGCPSSVPVIQAFDYVVGATDNSSGIFWKYQEPINKSSHLFLTPDSFGYYLDDDWGNRGVDGCSGLPFTNTRTTVKIDDVFNPSTSSHAGLYAVSSAGFDKSAYLFDGSATPVIRPIPIPQVESVRGETGEADLYWSEAQSAGDIKLIIGYLLFSFKTADEYYQPTDNDTWDQVDGLIAETSRTVSGLDSDNTYFFTLRIVYPDGFSTTHISGNSAAVKVTPPAFYSFGEPDPEDDPPPADPDETPEISDSDLGGATLPGMGGCGADGHLGFGFLPLFGICLLRRKNRS